MSVIYLLCCEPGEQKLRLHGLRFEKASLRQLLRIGIPAALQGAVFCFANLFVQASVNSFGAVATAGSAIATNFEYFGYYMITAYGQAATTFTSQNFAAGQMARCRAILRHCLAGAVLFSALVTVPLTVFRVQAAGWFSADGAVVQAACVRIVLILIFEPVCGLYEVPAGVLRGMGHSTAPAVLTVVGTCLLRVLWIGTVFRHVGTLPGLFAAFPVSWVVTSALMWVEYARVTHKKQL